MIFLTKKKQNEILSRIAANEIIARDNIECTKESIEKYNYTLDNLAEIAYSVAGIEGMKTVRDIVESH